jgi:hypothetical protein
MTGSSCAGLSVVVVVWLVAAPAAETAAAVASGEWRATLLSLSLPQEGIFNFEQPSIQQHRLIRRS